jgi:Glycosyl hydrolase family 46
MQRSIWLWATTTLVVFALGVLGAACDTETSLANSPYAPDAGPGGGSSGGGSSGGGSSGAGSSGGGSSGGGSSGAGSSGGAMSGDGAASTLPDGGCVYVDNDSFCACEGWTCGGFTVQNAKKVNEVVYCGQCDDTAYCQPDPIWGSGVGVCGGSNPLAYQFQKQKIDMLVSMGENDNVTVDYGVCSNIGDGRGYTIGKVGFCTGTGDFIIVAACYNILEPGNVLQKYWGTRDANGVALDGLIYYNDLYVSTGNNQGDTALIDKFGNFTNDVATAAKEAPPAGSTENAFQRCQDSMADADYLSAAAQHIDARGLKGALTTGFLYDTELNFGDEDDLGDGGTVGAITVMSRADTDYGAGLPTDFTGKPWEESRWLGFLIEERTKVMASNATWEQDLDQNATWEGARRLNTGTSNSPESATNLDMDFDLVSEYKAGSTSAGTPCWPTGLQTTMDTQSSIYKVSTNKSASSTDESEWTATGTLLSSSYAACPTNPTP